MEREFKYNKKSWICTNEDILKLCGKKAEKLVRCRKDRHGFNVVYQINNNQVQGFVSYHSILATNNQLI